ncbi:hypothetical protein STAS_25672 [Striga asiatica]|uniref:Uncharacterized protein n=1 Tax=Striga asiatica TaxID=4170 RepID=A0A5A7QVP8_STRAF|nr:hypothetical protein STAS_25672 [Striga asiatica]
MCKIALPSLLTAADINKKNGEDVKYQKHIPTSVYVAKPDPLVLPPSLSTSLDFESVNAIEKDHKTVSPPVISSVRFPITAKATNLHILSFVSANQIPTMTHIRHRITSPQNILEKSLTYPVAVRIINIRKTSHRLLATARAIRFIYPKPPQDNRLAVVTCLNTFRGRRNWSRRIIGVERQQQENREAEKRDSHH